jgi:small subunit ribosomal protein S5
MDEQNTQMNNVDVVPTEGALGSVPLSTNVAKPFVRNTSNKPRSFGGNRGGAPRRPFAERPKPEFDQKILSIRRVTRVVSGGRRFTFAVSMAIGDKKGGIGVGTGKALDTALAINKAIKSARKHMIKLDVTKEGSIKHDVKAKYSSSRIMIMPNRGKGLVAGSAIRDILILGGVKNATAKVLSGSKNKLNIARATIKALSSFAKPMKMVEKVEDKTEDK